MGMHYLIQAIFVLVGLLSVLAALFNWEWFFTAHNTQFIVSNAGRQRARLFKFSVLFKFSDGPNLNTPAALPTANITIDKIIAMTTTVSIFITFIQCHI